MKPSYSVIDPYYVFYCLGKFDTFAIQLEEGCFNKCFYKKLVGIGIKNNLFIKVYDSLIVAEPYVCNSRFGKYIKGPCYFKQAKEQICLLIEEYVKPKNEGIDEWAKELINGDYDYIED